MITVSLCMIVKNEQDTLERCLQSVRDNVDEIIIVDTGSTDRTKEIASKWTQQIYDFPWIDDFAAARNYSFARANMDYIIWLDADDVFLPEDSNKLSKLLQTMTPAVDAVSMQYHCDFDEYENVTTNVRRIRLLKRAKNYQWEGIVHEDIIIKEGTCYDSDIVVTHRKDHKNADPDRNIKIYENYLLQGKELALRDTLHYAMELHQHRQYVKAKEYYLKFMNMEGISEEDKINVCSKLADCYYYLGDRAKERESIFQSFEYDIPRPEFCCRLGYFFVEYGKFPQAAYWYKLATELPQPANYWAIQNNVSRTWLPHMQLGLCYYRMGKYDLSYYHNKIALTYRPDDRNIYNNLKLLEELMEEGNKAKGYNES